MENLQKNEKVSAVLEQLTDEEMNVIVVNHLKKVSDWDKKRILCEVLGVDNYMDDAGLRSAMEGLVTSTR